MTKPEAKVNVEQIERLYYWLNYHRLTIFIYGATFFLPSGVVLGILIILALIVAPYTLSVLYKNGKRGWLLAFGIIVGIPAGAAFIHTGNHSFDVALHFFPLLMFYFYCYILRYSAGEWVSNESIVGEKWVDANDRNNRLDH